MKKILIIALIASIPNLGQAQYEASKNVKRSYSVSGNGMLSINGKYGNVHVDTWEKKTVEMEVKIEVKKHSEKAATELLNNISIVIKDGDLEALSFRTSIDGSINNKSGENLKIEYWIKAPKSLAYTIKNNYGNLYLGDNAGQNNLNIAYGNMKIDNCAGSTDLKLSYGNGEIESISSGNLTINYSKISLEKVGKIKIVNNYSNLEMGNAASLHIENRYGNLKAKSVEVLNGYSKYGNVTINKMLKKVDFKVFHSGGLMVEWISKDFEKIAIEAKYGSIGLKFEEGFGASLDAKMTYCTLKFGDVSFDHSHVKEEAQHKTYKGIVGNKSNAGNRTISIVSSYGNGKIDYAE